jgi:hypothetical protein
LIAPQKGNRYGFFPLTGFQFSYSIGAAPCTQDALIPDRR